MHDYHLAFSCKAIYSTRISTLTISEAM